ncbi:hypothetical protein Tco_0496043 [Tanacetum coccineum]
MSLDQIRGLSNSGKKVVQDVAGSTSGSSSNTPLDARINDLESQMIEGKLVLLDEDGKIEVEEVYDETTTYMASTRFNVNKASISVIIAYISGWWRGNKSWYEYGRKFMVEDPFNIDDFDEIQVAQMKFD